MEFDPKRKFPDRLPTSHAERVRAEILEDRVRELRGWIFMLELELNGILPENVKGVLNDKKKDGT